MECLTTGQQGLVWLRQTSVSLSVMRSGRPSSNPWEEGSGVSGTEGKQGQGARKLLNRNPDSHGTLCLPQSSSLSSHQRTYGGIS